jgi:probable HAF family extracellular repeat protein
LDDVSGGNEKAVGFDTGLVLCTPTCSTQQSVAYMQTWMNSAPYLVTSLYLPSKNHTTDPNLNSTWVSGILSQGWSLIPIWVGAQPPCACKPNTGTYPNCTLYTTLISDVAATASSQGVSDAKAAEKQAVLLGAGGIVIYKDVENYNPASVLTNGTSCGTVVNAYLSSWDSQLHSNGYSAGAYGNPIPVANWSANVSPLPDDVWVAQANNQVTIWNVGKKYGMTDSMWPNSQRIHQYDIGPPHTEAWGGTPSFATDNDTVDATVVNPNATTKAYTYGTPTTIDCAGAVETVPLGINDMNGSALINGPGQMGAVVGYYQSAIGSPINGFENIGGDCTPITVSGSTYVEAVGINNLGQIVGYFEDSNGAFHGFLQNSGGTPTQIDYSGGGQTYLYGINDAGQAVLSSRL